MFGFREHFSRDCKEEQEKEIDRKENHHECENNWRHDCSHNPDNHASSSFQVAKVATAITISVAAVIIETHAMHVSAPKSASILFFQMMRVKQRKRDHDRWGDDAGKSDSHQRGSRKIVGDHSYSHLMILYFECAQTGLIFSHTFLRLWQSARDLCASSTLML